MKPVPRISTRGYYDRKNGKTLSKNSFYLYPKKEFTKLIGSKEITIMIHGLRNDNAGAITKIVLARNRLHKLGYKHPVIGLSYDSNTLGVHLAKYAKRALTAGQTIAIKNGKNLGLFIEYFKESSPNTKIRLMGHSLGSQVILSTLEYLAKKNNIKYQMEILPFGGTDAAGMQRSGKGPVCTLSVPTRYVHSPNEMIHKDDIEATIRLLVKFIENCDQCKLSF